MADNRVVTRFAPSPTGQLHVGGARTALFNWAFARRHGGTFILRIEDTDQARSTEAATRNILRDLHWLGIDWDEGPPPEAPPECLAAKRSGARPATAYHNPYDIATQRGPHGPYFQSQRLDIYHRYIDQLLAAGRAYKCFKTPEEIDADRQAARAAKQPYKYDRTESISLTPEQIAAYEKEGRPWVVRFRMPDADVTVHDLVLGDVTTRQAELEDFVIRKSDGFPTYHFAVVVDDALMEVTHILRGQEHLNNTPKHVALQDALGFKRPNYAHIPLIFNADGSKMSKRDKAKVARAHALQCVEKEGEEAFIQRVRDRNPVLVSGATSNERPTEQALRDFLQKKNDAIDVAAWIAEADSLTLPEIEVEDFRRSGYLPGALCNYLSLLGWSPGGDVERFDMAFLVEHFNIERIGKSNARFDRDKLFRFNAEAIVGMTPEQFRDQLDAYMRDYFREFRGRMDDEQFAAFAEAYRERSRTLKEPADNGRFFILADDAIDFDAKAVDKVLRKNDNEGFVVLREMREKLAALDDFAAGPIHELIAAHAEETSRGMGKIAQPLRVAVTGSTISPPIDLTLAILGKDSVLARIDRCIRLATDE